MNILQLLRDRFRPVLVELSDTADNLLEMIRPAQDARFGDYQANFAMPLGKQLGRAPREVAEQIVARLDVGDLCASPEIAGPGFINLRLRDDWIVRRLAGVVRDERLGIGTVSQPRAYVIDYSSPNVAKPMHVGHIRSTVIGDAIYRSLKFLGHTVISDNHLGDWGTQFGMIIYGFKHFVDRDHYATRPVEELSRLYKLVHRLVDYQNARRQLPEVESEIERRRGRLAAREGELTTDKERKRAKKELRRLRAQLAEVEQRHAQLTAKVNAVDADPELASLASQHADIAQAVLRETAKLHAGDPENRRLWTEFLPRCKEEVDKIYARLGIRFDQQLGESFYDDRLADIVARLQQAGHAQESDGAQCVFLPGFDAPMIVRKKDGAYLYATTDLATIQYRMETWNPDVILYVVDHRQHEHFEKLFAAARLLGYTDVELRHIQFGTVLGDDGKPFRTRSGDVVGLEGLLDEAVKRAHDVVCRNDDSKPGGPELSESQRREIARVVGHAALKYADLSHNRTSDYVFNYDKMVALEGNTATYMQYCYARTQSIFARGGIDVEALRAENADDILLLGHPLERELAIELLRFGDAVDEMLDDYRPNILTNYLFSLATRFSKFYQQCDVLRAESDRLRNSRLILCDLTGRTIRCGLAMLGIDVVDKM